MNIKRVSIEQVQNWEDNPRNIKTKDFERLKRQIKELGVYKPMIACPENGGYTVLGGNMRLRALKELGIKEVEISIVHPKSKAEKIKYALSDNDRAGEYEEEKLAELVYPHIDEIELGDYKIDVGEPVNLQDVIEDYAPNLDGSEDEVPETDDSPAITKTGDLFKLGRHRLLCGDATKEEDVKRLMNGEKADMVFTDPPYGLGGYHGRTDKFKPIKGDNSDIKPLLKAIPNCSEKYICCEWKTYPSFLEILNEPKSLIVWAKNFFGMGQGYRRQHEFILYYGNLKKTNETDLWQFDKEGDLKHPAQKPLILVIRAIKNSDGQKVWDGYLGSGTTLIACEKLNRICYGMEIDPKYCDVIIKRYADYTGTPEEKIRETVEHG